MLGGGEPSTNAKHRCELVTCHKDGPNRQARWNLGKWYQEGNSERGIHPIPENHCCVIVNSTDSIVRISSLPLLQQQLGDNRERAIPAHILRRLEAPVSS